MNALTIPAPRSLALSADALGRVLVTLEADRPASRDLDADVMQALGWIVTRSCGRQPGASWMMRSPLARDRVPLPRLSRRTDSIKALVPPHGWDWGVSERDGRGKAWCSNGLPPGPGAAWFEQVGLTGELAFLRAALHATRSLIVNHKCLPPVPAPASYAAVPAARPSRWRSCRCGWEGPGDALLHGGRCPDCGTHTMHGQDA